MTEQPPIERVFVTGASGFVGEAVVRELLSRGYGINALVHRRGVRIPGDVRCVEGGLFDSAALEAGLGDAQAVVHLVGIISEKPRRGITFDRIHFEGTKRVVDTAKRCDVRRFVQMSANGVGDDAKSDYHRSKWRAEKYVRASGLDWTIFQPSMILGEGGEFMRMLADWAKRRRMPYLFMPYFGGGWLGRAGGGRIQPVRVEDVARAFADALTNPKSISRTYGLGGMEVYTWPQFYRIVATALIGRPRAVLPIPAWYANLLTRLLPATMLPFNRDQVVMSQDSNTVDSKPFMEDFGWVPGRVMRDG